MPTISGGNIIAGAQLRLPSSEDTAQRGDRIVKVALAAVGTGGGVLAWANPESGSIIITGFSIDVTTQSTGACTVDFGTTATSATTTSDNLMDGVSVAATGVLSSIDDKGTNGRSRQKLATGKWVTGSVASGTVTGLVGYAYIRYYVV